MKKMRLIALLLALVTVLSLLTACGKKEEIIAEAPDIQMEIDRPEPEPVVEEPNILNPLTGEEVTEEVRARRPYAIMLNNLSAALPQHGNSQADIQFVGHEEITAATKADAETGKAVVEATWKF